MFLVVMETCLFLLVFTFLITQFAIPLYRGTPFFPIFRKEGKLISELQEINQQKIEAKLAEEIKTAQNPNNNSQRSDADATTNNQQS